MCTICAHFQGCQMLPCASFVRREFSLPISSWNLGGIISWDRDAVSCWMGVESQVKNVLFYLSQTKRKQNWLKQTTLICNLMKPNYFLKRGKSWREMFSHTPTETICVFSPLFAMTNALNTILQSTLISDCVVWVTHCKKKKPLQSWCLGKTFVVLHNHYK